MKHLILPLALLLATPVAAQERMDAQACQGGLNAVMSMVSPNVTQPESSVSDDGWCVINDLDVPIDRFSTARIENLRWRAADMARVFEQGLPPRTLEMVAVGLRVVPQSGDQVLDYLLAVQSRPSSMGFGLDLRWDGVQNAVILEQAYFDFYPGNRISATARFDGVNLTDMTAIQMSAGTAGLSNLNMSVEFDGWFETILAVPLGSALLEGGEAVPEAQVAAMKRQAVDFISQIPEALMPQPSRDALSAFVNSLPHPRGKAQLQLSGTPPIGMTRAMPFASVTDLESMLAAMPVALDGVSMLFTWTPKTGE